MFSVAACKVTKQEYRAVVVEFARIVPFRKSKMSVSNHELQEDHGNIDG